MGEGKVQRVPAGQVALRFPGEVGKPPRDPGGHLDGIGTGINGIEKGDFLRNFTMLAVVLLADLPEAYSGNFTVWPGSHAFFQTYFREHGWADIHEGLPKDQYPEARCRSPANRATCASPTTRWSMPRAATSRPTFGTPPSSACDTSRLTPSARRH